LAVLRFKVLRFEVRRLAVSAAGGFKVLRLEP
jgi:hypothetical protein